MKNYFINIKKNKMKKLMLFAVSILIIGSGFKIAYEAKKSTGEVEQEEGMYVFYRSKPITDYDYVGTYKIGVVWDDNPKLLFSKLIRKTKEKFPGADGIIIDNDMGKCDAIKFKN